MQYKLDFDKLIEQAVYDAFTRITIIHTPRESNLDRVAHIAADELIRNWGPEVGAVLEKAIRVEMERQLNAFLTD